MLTTILPTEELNEEDQNLKNELEMLVERLKVLVCQALVAITVANFQSITGARHIPVSPRPRCHQELYKNIYIVDDGCSEALEVPPTAL